MARFFAKQKKPSKSKNFFQNYFDHVNYLSMEFDELFKKLQHSDANKTVKLLFNEALKRINVFDPLRDGYDYADEVLGATVMPLLATGAAFVFLGLAIYEFVNSNSKSNTAALSLLVAAGASLIFSAAMFIKSAISLLTRPVITLAQGAKPQNTVRFYDADVAARNENLVQTVTDGISGTFGFN